MVHTGSESLVITPVPILIIILTQIVCLVHEGIGLGLGLVLALIVCLVHEGIEALDLSFVQERCRSQLDCPPVCIGTLKF